MFFLQEAMAYQEFIHRLELGFQTFRVDFERKLMVLADLYSGPNYILEAITGHSGSSHHSQTVTVVLAAAEEARARLGCKFCRVGVTACRNTPWRTPQLSELVAIHVRSPTWVSLTFLTASQNEAAIKNMLYGQLLCNLVPAIIRILLRGQTFRDSKKAIVFYFLSLALSQFLYQHLKTLGTPRRDSKANLVSSGDDLNQPGMTEWMFDILYISCKSIKRS
jgi:hypothetical protein